MNVLGEWLQEPSETQAGLRRRPRLCWAVRWGRPSVSEEQHPLRALLPYEVCILQHNSLLTWIFLVVLINTIRHGRSSVKHA